MNEEKSLAECLFELMLMHAESIRYYEQAIRQTRGLLGTLRGKLERNDTTREFTEDAHTLCKAVGEHSSLFTLMHHN